MENYAALYPRLPGEEVIIDLQEQRARLIPFPPRNWSDEVKQLHENLQNALINKKGYNIISDFLVLACNKTCNEKVDLLLICSWMQTYNLIRSLNDVVPHDKWVELFDLLESKIISSGNKYIQFNLVNLRNSFVVKILADICHINIAVYPPPNGWTKKIVWGQFFGFHI